MRSPAEGQEQVGVLKGHDASDMGWGDQVAFSPDGKWLAAGSEDGVELWELNLPAGDSRPVEPRGKQLATWGRIKRGSP